MKHLLDSYAKNGYLVISEVLSSQEVADANRAIDDDLIVNRRLWKKGQYPGLVNNNILVANSEFDITLRPSKLLPFMEALMGPNLCADQHEVVIRPPNPNGPVQCDWHRDGEKAMPPPFYTYLLQIIFYLTDVTDETHCFSVIPGSSQCDDFPPLKDYDLRRADHITGSAGTAILCNGAIFHALNFRKTLTERRTVHSWIGRTTQPAMANYTIFPRRLCHSSDKETAKYYSRVNEITKLLLLHF